MLIERAYAKARDVLATHRDKLDALATRLIEEETLSSEQIEALIGLPPANNKGASQRTSDDADA